MKLLVVTSLKEFREETSKLLDEAGIEVFSVTETVGYKRSHQQSLTSGWYGSSDGKFNSLFFFSFTDDATATRALELIRSCNTERKSRFPVRGFVLPVEQST